MKSNAAINPAQDHETGYQALVQSNPDNLQTLSLLIGGVHCAGCIQKIESSLYRDPSVRNARLNFSTGRLTIVWEGLPEKANLFVQTVQGLGYRVNPYDTGIEKSTAENENRFLLMCLGVSGFATGNIMLLSLGLWITDIASMGFATREFMHWISALIAIPAVIYAGRPFFISALGALRGGHTNMDVPISLALVLATGMSVLEMLRGAEHVYFDSAVMLMFILLIGRYLDFRARRAARSAATDLMSTLAGFATVVEDGKSRRVPVRDVREGMIVSVAAGEKFPVDGVIQTGESSADTSLVTGETLPRVVTRGDEIYAGTLNLSAPVTIKVSSAAEDSLLADIVRLMEKAEQGQARYVRIADRAAKLYTPVVHTLAAAAFVMWLFLGEGWQHSLMIAVTVLIITCPCALGLAVPVVQVLATSLLMKRGILVKAGDALERLAGVDTVLLDKTGTLTHGVPRLVGAYDDRALQLAASLASQSAHPLSKALAGAWAGSMLSAEDVIEHAGQGLEGRYQGNPVRLGSRAWCGTTGADGHADLELWLAIQGEAPVMFRFEDKLRDDAAETIRVLKSRGLRVVLLSGDRREVAERMAAACGIEEAYGEQKPPEKFAFMERLKAQGRKVLMVGDGLNDAPVLAGADVSMAPGTAIDMAQNAADIVFMGDKMGPVAKAYDIAVFTQKLVRENLFLAVIYNVVAVPMAFMGMVTPMVAAIAMSGSSIVVIANSFRLKRAV